VERWNAKTDLQLLRSTVQQGQARVRSTVQPVMVADSHHRSGAPGLTAPVLTRPAC